MVFIILLKVGCRLFVVTFEYVRLIFKHLLLKSTKSALRDDAPNTICDVITGNSEKGKKFTTYSDINLSFLVFNNSMSLNFHVCELVQLAVTAVN